MSGFNSEEELQAHVTKRAQDILTSMREFTVELIKNRPLDDEREVEVDACFRFLAREIAACEISIEVLMKENLMARGTQL